MVLWCIGLSVYALIVRTIVKLLDIRAEAHLSPVEKVLGRSASEIIVSHEGHPGKINVTAPIETADALDKCPGYSRYVLEHLLSICLNDRVYL